MLLYSSKIMDLILLMLCIPFYIALADPQEDQEAAVLQKDLQEYFRRLSQRPLETTQNFRTSFLPNVYSAPMRQQREGAVDETLFPYPSLVRGQLQSNPGRGAHSFASASASASASAKRPDIENEASAKAAAFSSVEDVNAEEHLGDDEVAYEMLSTPIDERKTSPSRDEATLEVVPENRGPYTSKHQQVETVIRKEDDSFSDVYFVAIVAGCCAVGIFGVISAGICFYRLQKSQKAAADVDYPAYGVTGPCKDVTSPNGDRKLAQSAQMYHFQLQKQQMIAVEKAGSTKNTSASDVDSEEENEEGDYTVYECPGLAPSGEMEVKNPLFHDDSTPVSPPMLPDKAEGHHQNN